MQHQPTKSALDVNRDWTPEQRDEIIALSEAINSNPLLSVDEKLNALIALIREEPK